MRLKKRIQASTVEPGEPLMRALKAEFDLKDIAKELRADVEEEFPGRVAKVRLYRRKRATNFIRVVLTSETSADERRRIADIAREYQGLVWSDYHQGYHLNFQVLAESQVVDNMYSYPDGEECV